MLAILPGLILALILAVAGQYLSVFIGIDLMGLPKSPVSAIMMAILLGILIRNTVSLPASFQPGIRFGLVRVLRLGIVLLGIRLSLVEVGEIGDGRILVACGEGTLEIMALQRSGSRRQSAAEFLRGRPVDIGERLAPHEE